ncbi:Adenylate kinase 7 [Liparis tanakae]|uniref:Adenylate kinase 7 n=1 Tax=Liparis tanakae TaxID=230148 RepID=A0A4Z2EFZ6_9TELE|nr:Adenylate kinase 7 [Liparis tanakae]
MVLVCDDHGSKPQAVSFTRRPVVVLQEVPFTDELFWLRRAHPNFKRHIALEKRVVQMGKTRRSLFSTYVLASGLQYGMGEHVLHSFFKVIEVQPRPYYLLAVDSSNDTLEDILKAVASALGPWATPRRPPEEALLSRELSVGRSP